jgi:hypothetical protein
LYSYIDQYCIEVSSDMYGVGMTYVTLQGLCSLCRRLINELVSHDCLQKLESEMREVIDYLYVCFLYCLGCTALTSYQYYVVLFASQPAGKLGNHQLLCVQLVCFCVCWKGLFIVNVEMCIAKWLKVADTRYWQYEQDTYQGQKVGHSSNILLFVERRCYRRAGQTCKGLEWTVTKFIRVYRSYASSLPINHRQFGANY